MLKDTGMERGPRELPKTFKWCRYYYRLRTRDYVFMRNGGLMH